MPPITKNIERGARRRGSPIFLWSMVVNQLQNPVVAFGRRRISGRGERARLRRSVIGERGAHFCSSRKSAICSASARVISGWPFGVFSVNDGMPTHVRSPTGRHSAVLGLHRDHRRARSSTQSTRFFLFSSYVALAKTCAAREVREVRAVRWRRRVVEGVAVGALVLVAMSSWAGPAGTASAPSAFERWRLRRALLLLAEPLLEVVGGLRDHPEAHVGVRQPAVLLALPEEGPGFVGLERELVVVGRARRRVYPRARAPRSCGSRCSVSASHAFSFRCTCATGRDDQLVGGDDLGVGVLELPPPLLADDRDLERVGLRVRRRGRRSC